MDDRIERLLGKAEAAIDDGNSDAGEEYRVLALSVAYLRRQEAKTMNRMLNSTPQGQP